MKKSKDGVKGLEGIGFAKKFDPCRAALLEILVSPRPGEGILSSFIAPEVRVLAKHLERITSGFRLPAKDPETINFVRSCDPFRAILLPELRHLR